MDKLKIRAVIQFFYLQGKCAKEIHQRLLKTLKDSSPSYESVRLWVKEFKNGRTCITDAPRQGGPRTAVTAKSIQKVQEMIIDDRQIRVRDLGEALCISAERVHFILRTHLNMKKVCFCWVSSTLTTEEKNRRKQAATDCLNIYNMNNDFLERAVVVGQASIRCFAEDYNNGTEEQPDNNWEPKNKKARNSKTHGTVMVIICWDAKGIIMLDYYIKEEQRLDAEYYQRLFKKLQAELLQKCYEKKKRKTLLQYDGVYSILCNNFHHKLTELNYELLPHPTNSPDLTPTHYYLLPKLRTALTGKRFKCKEEVFDNMREYFSNMGTSHFYDGICSLEQQWKKCIQSNGEYVDRK